MNIFSIDDKTNNYLFLYILSKYGFMPFPSQDFTDGVESAIKTISDFAGKDYQLPTALFLPDDIEYYSSSINSVHKKITENNEKYLIDLPVVIIDTFTMKFFLNRESAISFLKNAVSDGTLEDLHDCNALDIEMTTETIHISELREHFEEEEIIKEFGKDWKNKLINND